MSEKPKARELVTQNLKTIRDAVGTHVTVTVRTNSIDSGMFFDDVRAILSPESARHIDGFCCTKVDTVEMANEICSFLSSEEKRHGLEA